ncbi:hypothetical protein [Micromonospora aurantiaca (nom. illeg.)]|uniref:hypothetical protein n=1 Tax=Micromonospora aurantiaca (nom. illeg.) TaxID=47850 RepID=UPI003F54663E
MSVDHVRRPALIGRAARPVDGRFIAVPRERLSALAALPDDVIDPLLWRLALDVVAAHQPDEPGNCRNLQCAGQRGMCAAASTARRAMALAHRPGATATSAGSRPAHGRAAARRPAAFRGWFSTSLTQPEAEPPSRQPPAWSVAVLAA